MQMCERVTLIASPYYSYFVKKYSVPVNPSKMCTYLFFIAFTNKGINQPIMLCGTDK